MESVGEEELVQMVRDFIESETPTTSSKPPSLNHQPILQEVLGQHTDEEAEIYEKILMYVKDLGHDQTTSSNNNELKKLVVMKLRSDGYEAYLCKTSWLCTTSTHKRVSQFPGGYEYIDVMVVEKGNNGGRPTIPKRVIVDMEFRCQFELARPTASYKELMNNLPLIFVGTEEKLNWTIPLLCSAAQKSLNDNGLHVPPWRKPAYMKSKWLSKNCKKSFCFAAARDINGLLQDNHHHHHKTEEKSTTCFSSIFSRSQLHFA